MTAPAEPVELDGRRQRSERSREAVVDALLACYDDGTIRPSGAEIAERAGVSERSVFRHFADLEALATEAIRRQLRRVAPYFEPPSGEGSLDERVAALAEQRARLHDRMGNMARAAAFHAVGSPTIAATVADRQRVLRDQVAVQFAAELGALAPRDRRLTVAALDAVSSIEGMEHLRTSGEVGPRNLEVVLRRSLAALLVPPPPTQEHP